MLILRAENHRRMRWKNGGGETAEIAVFPEGAGLDDFGWRVSMATVEAGGPFSAFPSVDRTLSILEGEGIALEIDGRPPVTLTQGAAPYGFAADAATHANLVGGPISDLNVMTRRGVYRHKVGLHDLRGLREISWVGEAALVFCGSGSLLVDAGERQEKLDRFDAALLDNPQAGLRVEGSGRFFLIELSPVAAR
jgi:environmental stress-induced protein Ves